jgi:adenylylsulfate kinase
MKYNLFIGRFSPFHNGHKAIIDSFVDNGKPVCIAIRQSEEKYTALERYQMIRAVYGDRVKIIQIPDIEQVCIGRKVGYSIVEVPEDIKQISGTKIRNGKSTDVPKEVQELIDKWDL